MRPVAFWKLACLTAAVLLLFESSARTESRAQSGQESKDKKAQASKTDVVDGAADVLKIVPKKFATFLGAAADSSSVKLYVQGETRESTWPVHPDAEIKIRGWWGRLDQLKSGDRVWVWFALDRKQQAKRIMMLADEMSEQDIHNLPVTLESIDPNGQTVTIVSSKGATRTEPLAAGMRVRQGRDSFEFMRPGEPLVRARPADRVYVQGSADGLEAVLNADGLEALREAQTRFLRARWREQGLPGTIVFLHPVSGEMDVMLDHEGMRWGRYLKAGDQVKLATAAPIAAVVKDVEPLRERTHVRLATQSGLDQGDFAIGGRVGMIVPEPPAKLQESPYPLDLGRAKSKPDRIAWFLSSVYCTCSHAGDQCAGMFYTQASCNEKRCNMPKTISTMVSELIDEGLSDRAILQQLAKERGPNLLKPHLLQ